jgi:hypothetical protein
MYPNYWIYDFRFTILDFGLVVMKKYFGAPVPYFGAAPTSTNPHIFTSTNQERCRAYGAFVCG